MMLRSALGLPVVWKQLNTIVPDSLDIVSFLSVPSHVEGPLLRSQDSSPENVKSEKFLIQSMIGKGWWVPQKAK